MWSDDIRHEAAERARQDGRDAPSVRDLFEVAVDGSGPQIRMASNHFFRHLPAANPPTETSAGEDEFDDIFRRAAALAVALDQDPADDHVVVVCSLHPDAGDPGVRGFIRQLALQSVGQFDAEAHSALFERIRDAQQPQSFGGQSASGFVPLRPVGPPADAGFAGEPGLADPCCTRCGTAVEDNLEGSDVTVGDRTIHVVACGVCGAVQGIQQ